MKKRLIWLDVIRALAILLIVAFHLIYAVDNDQDLRPIGFIGASLFFIASGFALAYRYPNLTSFDLGWFFKRYVKIASLYYPALIMCALLFPVQTYYRGIQDLVLHFLFLNFISHDTAFSIISAAWFIIPLMAFYLAFPYLNRFTKQSRYFLVLAVLLTLASSFVENSWISFSPLFFLGEFCFGISIAQKKEDASFLSPVILALVNPVMVVPYALFYIFSKIQFTENTLTRLSTIIGEYTFEIFLFHEAMIMVLLNDWHVYQFGWILSLLILSVSILMVVKISKKIRCWLQPATYA